MSKTGYRKEGEVWIYHGHGGMNEAQEFAATIGLLKLDGVEGPSYNARLMYGVAPVKACF